MTREQFFEEEITAIKSRIAFYESCDGDDAKEIVFNLKIRLCELETMRA